MADITVNKANDVFLTVEAEPGIRQELSDSLTFEVPNARFSPGFKSGYWDGKIRIFSAFKGLLPAGLLGWLQKWADERNYELKIGFSAQLPPPVDDQVFDDFVRDLNLPANREPRDYQLAAVRFAIDHMRAVLLSPTASGKSLIIHMIASWFNNMNSLVIVPTKSLVLQMRGDFISYGCDPKDIQILMGGETNKVTARIVITTWQSAQRQTKQWLGRYGCVFGDEAHLFTAKKLGGIMDKMTECVVRIGTTGTLDGSKVHSLVLTGMFGSVVKVATTKELMEAGHISNLRVRCIVLKYRDEERKLVSKMTYDDERVYINAHERRREFVKKLVLYLKGNTLVLCNNIDTYCIPMYELIKAAVAPGRKVFIIHGAISAERREEIRSLVENESDAIIVASYGTFQAGVSINNLNNAVAASPTKSLIRVLQSIGRTLRLHDEKSHATWYDIADDFKWKSSENYTLEHFTIRAEIYAKEGFDCKISSREI